MYREWNETEFKLNDSEIDTVIRFIDGGYAVTL